MKKDLSLKNRFGETLNVKMMMPDNPMGTVIVHHGWGGSMKSPVVERLAEVFFKSDLVTLVPDTSNSMNSSGGKIKNFTFKKHASDLADVAQWTAQQDWFTDNLHLAGYSLGGYSAARAAQERDDVKTLLLIAPILSGEFFYEALEAEGIVRLWKNYGSLTFVTDLGEEFDAPYGVWYEWLGATSLPEAGKFKGNVSILTAGADSFILPSHVSAARAAFDNARFTAQVIRHEDHAFNKQPGNSKNGPSGKFAWL